MARIAPAPRCKFCCPTCRGHFATLKAFDMHRVDGRCDFLDERILEIPRPGFCRYSDQIGVTIYTTDERYVA